VCLPLSYKGDLLKIVILLSVIVVLLHLIARKIYKFTKMVTMLQLFA
jgi:hypothetical protein